MDEWGPSRLDDAAALVATAMPHEGLTLDELLAVCWDDPGVVLADPAGEGLASAVIRRWGDLAVGYVRLLAVHPGARRRGIGRALLGAAEQWCFDQGAAEVHLGGSAPFYLWPGVDTRALAMLCLVEEAAYEVTGTELNMSLPTTFRADPPGTVEVRRALEDEEGDAVRLLVERHWSWWWDEVARSIEQGSCLVAWPAAGGPVVGFACHSVNRAGWVGPMGTDPDRQHGGVGHALLGAVCRDLMVANFRDAEIAWVGPIRFYAKAGASVSRVFRTYRKRRP